MVGLDNYEDWELVSELQDREYDFSEELEDDELVDILKDRGYSSHYEYAPMSLVDSMNIEELTEGFRELNFEEQQLVLALVTKLRK